VVKRVHRLKPELQALFFSNRRVLQYGQVKIVDVIGTKEAESQWERAHIGFKLFTRDFVESGVRIEPALGGSPSCREGDFRYVSCEDDVSKTDWRPALVLIDA
jgi:hypothetical protein